MKNPVFINNEIYHLYNRGVDKRKIFNDDNDYFRFIHDLFEFNDEAAAFNLGYFYNKKQPIEVRLQYIQNKKPRRLLVEILAFCLMPNHFHLLIRQKNNKGITEFMRKLGTGYTNFFNQKYERSGSLFQGCFKAILINQESHFIYLPYYIHCNPLDLIEPEWRQQKIKDYKKTVKFLETYRWSSYLDYIGKKNFPSVTQREFLLKFFGGIKQYQKDIIKWLKEMDLEKIKDLTLESESIEVRLQ